MNTFAEHSKSAVNGGGLRTFIFGSPALFRDCVEEEAEMTPEPLAELRSLPNDSEEPSPEVEDMEPDPDPEDRELCLNLLRPCPSRCFLPGGGGCNLNLKGDKWGGSSPRWSG